jgi:diacylglycerol kinase family enzyme
MGRVSALVEALTRQGVKVDVTSVVADLKRITSENSSGKPDFVVAAGGDGTLSLVAQTSPPETVIAPMPTGTENLVSKHFGISSEVVPMNEMLMAGRTVAIDAGLANGRLFLVMVTCGFDAEVVRAMHLTRRGHISRLSYFGPIMRALRRYQFPELRVTVIDEVATSPDPAITASSKSMKSKSPTGSFASTATADPIVLPTSQSAISQTVACRWAMVFNLPRYAAGLGIEPQAVGDDGVLNLCAMQDGSILGGLRYLAGIITKRHSQWPDVVRHQITACEISSPASVAYQIDGDYGGKLPLKIGVLPGRVRLRLPPIVAS